MSIEHTLERIATALEAIVYAASTVTATPPAPVATAPAPDAPVPPAPAVPVPPVPVPAIPVPPIPAPAIPAATGAPFTDAKGLMAYCMEKYKALGPTKGGMIQQVLIELGVNNISSLTVDQYGAFYQKVEAL